MKTIQLFLAALCCANVQAAEPETIVQTSDAISIQGGIIPMPNDAFTDAQHFEHKEAYLRSRDNLISQGKLTINRGGFQPQFIIPIQSTTTDPGFYGISNYVDHDLAFNGNVEDYMCRDRTTDTINSNHQGIDFFIWPYAWHKMDNNEVEVVAAADGTITVKEDGHSDRNCDSPDTEGNFIYITYDDGSYSYYRHLKNGSLTTKEENETVVQGEYLGVVGSSGSSTGPHLHFETYDKDGNLIDPFYVPGQCNRMNSISWWLDQEDYHESQINQLATHDVAPAFPSCPQTVDTPNYQDDFQSGDTVYLAAYYRDIKLGQQSLFRVFQPDGSEFGDSQEIYPDQASNAAYQFSTVELPTNAQTGKWTFKVEYNTNTYEHTFYVGDLIFESGFEQ